MVLNISRLPSARIVFITNMACGVSQFSLVVKRNELVHLEILSEKIDYRNFSKEYGY